MRTQPHRLITQSMNQRNRKSLQRSTWTMAKGTMSREAQVAMQRLLCYQVMAHAAAATARKGVTLPPLQLYSGLPQEWPMARLCISSKQVNRYVRTILWRRVAERAFRETYFGRIPAEVCPAFIEDLLQISQAFAAPLADLFAFVKQGHQPLCLYPSKAVSAPCEPPILAVWPFSVCIRVLCL